MLKVGLTGNLGSGKNTIAGIFQILDVPVYHADDVSKSFLSEEFVQQEIRSFFGWEVFSGPREIDRKKLGRIVFSDPEKLAFLNSILHPLVKEDFTRWTEKSKDRPYIIHEAAIIFESGFEKEFDRIIHVSCPEEIAIERSVRRDNTERDEVKKRMRFQWKDEKKAAISDFIILNDGSEMVILQVLNIHNQLIKLNPEK